jgi:hypothetical protein
MRLAPEHFERVLRSLQGTAPGHDKRRAERFPVTSTVEFARTTGPQANVWQIGLTLHLSEMGLGMVTTAPAERGERVAVRLPDGAGGRMTMLCVVAHSRPLADGLFGLGMEFDEITEHSAAPPTAGATVSGGAKPRRERAPAR